MKYTFKYSLGDTVYTINKSSERIVTKCPACEGSGSLRGLDGKEQYCPGCHGEGNHKSWGEQVHTVDKNPYTIGQLRLHYDDCDIEEAYMFKETGVGSGSVYKGDHVFQTEEEAQAKCDVLNGQVDGAFNG